DEGEMIEVALDEDDPLFPADRFARLREAVEKALFLEDRGLGRVQVLEPVAFLRQRAPSEPHGSAPLVAHDEDQPVAETVVGAAPAILPRLKQTGFDEQAFGESGRQR